MRVTSPIALRGSRHVTADSRRLSSPNRELSIGVPLSGARLTLAGLHVLGDKEHSAGHAGESGMHFLHPLPDLCWIRTGLGGELADC
jgi:hypothetical protein